MSNDNDRIDDVTYVIKRKGIKEEINFDKIHKRIKYLINEPYELKNINSFKLVQNVIQKLNNNIKTSDIDTYTADLSASLSILHRDYLVLAGRIIINNHHKNTLNSFKDKIELLYMRKVNGEIYPLINDIFYKYVKKNQTKIDKYIDYDRDYNFDYFSFGTLEKGYLMKLDNKIIERPQDLFMRVAIQIHMPLETKQFKDPMVLQKIFKCYDMMSNKYYIHATPTLFNAGNRLGNFSSCFEENTLVDTLRGPVKIKDVVIGDEVITHNGNVKKVLQTHKNLINGRNLYKVNIFKTQEFIATEDHKLWTYSKKENVVGWKEIKDLTKNDYISIPNYSGSIESDIIDIKELLCNYKQDIIYEDNKCYTQFDNETNISNKINDKIIVDQNFMKFLGIYLCNGYIVKKKDINDIYQIRGISIIIHNNNIKLIEFCKSMEKHFGLKNVYVHSMPKQNIIQVFFLNPILGYVFQELYGEGFGGKKLNDKIFHYSNNLIYELLSGIILSDSYKSNNGIITLRMSNELFIRQIYTLCRIHNMDVGCIKKSEDRLKCVQYYKISISNLEYNINILKKDDDIELMNKNLGSKYVPIIKDGFKFIQFNKKELTTIESEYVYTLGVEDDHSYSIAGIVAQNCFLLGTQDSREGIMKTLDDCTKISKYAGGIGVHISNWRAEGSLIRGTNGNSNGIIPFLRQYNDAARAFNQGGKRKGSFAMYIEPHHPDILKFLDLRKNVGDENERCRDLFLALWISDLFMERVVSNSKWSLFCPDKCPGLNECYGEEYKNLYLKYENDGMSHSIINARDIWQATYTSQMESGIPYICYKDQINRCSMQHNLGVIKSSNLCVSGETLILTDKGYYPIKQLTEEKPLHKVWNGEVFTDATFAKTGENQQLLEIELDHGNVIKCTPYHKFLIMVDLNEIIIEAKNLKIGDRIIKNKFPIIQGNKEFPYSYTHGIFSVDGLYDKYDYLNEYCENKSSNSNYYKTYLELCKDLLGSFKKFQNSKLYPKLYLYGEKKNLLKFIEINSTSNIVEYNDRLEIYLPIDMPDKFEVPINYNLNSRLNWLAGLLDANGCLYSNNNNLTLHLPSIHKNFLEKVKFLCNTLGINPIISTSRQACRKIIHDNDNFKYYNYTTLYVLIFSGWDINKLYELNLPTKRLTYNRNNYSDSVSNNFNKIKSIRVLENKEDTYCFNEPLKHRGIFNGLLLGNCAEIVEYSDSREYGTCFTGDTKVLTKEGYRRIDECNDKEVLSYYNNDIDLKKHETFTKAVLIDNGIKDVYELICSGTNSVKATDDHLFLTLKKRNKTKVNVYEWKSLSELKVNDKILLPNNNVLPSYDIEPIIDEDYLTIGWLLGDVWQSTDKNDRTAYNVYFSPTDITTKDRVISKLHEWSEFTKYNNKNYYNDNNGVYKAESYKENFVKFIQDNFGLMCNITSEKIIPEKIIPEKIIKSNPNKLASMLSGLFSADGCVYIGNDSTYTRFYISLLISSKQLLNQVQNLLRCFGIDSRSTWNYNSSRDKFQGKLIIDNKSSIQRYNKYIGFELCEPKQNKLKLLLNIITREQNVFQEYVKVKSINYIGKEKVYDLYIPEKHNFIVEGMVVHNCNLSSICLPKFVIDTWSEEELLIEEDTRRKLDHEFPLHPVVDYKLLAEVAGDLTENLNNIIDKNWNPVIETARSNFNHRPIGIGVQGLADVFMKFRIPFESDEAKQINKKIFEAIYYGALTRSTKLAKDIYMNINNQVADIENKEEIVEENNDGENLESDNKTENEKRIKSYKFCLYPKHVQQYIVQSILDKTINSIENNTVKLDNKEIASYRNKIIHTFKKENELYTFFKQEDVPKLIGSYPSYLKNGGSPLYKGKFHWEIFGIKEEELSGLFDWQSLRMHIEIYGVRNSLLCAAMPTASTSQIMGCTSCFEPYVSNSYKRTTLAGEYAVINKYLLKDLQESNIWSEKMRNHIILNNGSIQSINGIPPNMKEIYKTVWEIKQKSIIDMAKDRQAFIDQSQSMNLFIEDFNYKKFNTIQMYAWKSGLKTGSYYIRTRPAIKGEYFTIDPSFQKELELKDILLEQEKNKTVIKQEEEICLMCSS
jgi:ribonucleotide reductase alpha subunit